MPRRRKYVSPSSHVRSPHLRTAIKKDMRKILSRPSPSTTKNNIFTKDIHDPDVNVPMGINYDYVLPEEKMEVLFKIRDDLRYDDEDVPVPCEELEDMFSLNITDADGDKLTLLSQNANNIRFYLALLGREIDHAYDKKCYMAINVRCILYMLKMAVLKFIHYYNDRPIQGITDVGEDALFTTINRIWCEGFVDDALIHFTRFYYNSHNETLKEDYKEFIKIAKLFRSSFFERTSSRQSPIFNNEIRGYGFTDEIKKELPIKSFLDVISIPLGSLVDYY